MRFHRIYAIILRQLYAFKSNYDRLTDAFYWPSIDILLWGLTGAFYESQGVDVSNIVFALVSGIIFWNVIWRASNEISLSTVAELWDRNLINIFGSPLRFSEWLFAFIFLSIIKVLVSLPFIAFLAYLLYEVDAFSYGFYLIPFLILLLLNGWWIGFLVAGLVLRFGKRVQTLVWTLVYLFAPLSGIFYPISILPPFVQKIAFFVPASHVFEGVREVINTGYLSANKIFISLTLNTIYLVLSFIVLRACFSYLLNKGLVKAQ